MTEETAPKKGMLSMSCENSELIALIADKVNAILDVITGPFPQNAVESMAVIGLEGRIKQQNADLKRIIKDLDILATSLIE